MWGVVSTVNSCEQYSTVNNASRGTVDNCRSKYTQLIIVRGSTVNNGRTGRAAGGQAACTVDSSSSFLQDGAASPALFIKCKASKVGRSTISLFSRSRLQDQNSARGVCIQWYHSTVKVCSSGKRSPVSRVNTLLSELTCHPPPTCVCWCPRTPENGFHRGGVGHL